MKFWHLSWPETIALCGSVILFVSLIWISVKLIVKFTLHNMTTDDKSERN